MTDEELFEAFCLGKMVYLGKMTSEEHLNAIRRAGKKLIASSREISDEMRKLRATTRHEDCIEQTVKEGTWSDEQLKYRLEWISRNPRYLHLSSIDVAAIRWAMRKVSRPAPERPQDAV